MGRKTYVSVRICIYFGAKTSFSRKGVTVLCYLKEMSVGYVRENILSDSERDDPFLEEARRWRLNVIKTAEWVQQGWDCK